MQILDSDFQAIPCYSIREDDDHDAPQPFRGINAPNNLPKTSELYHAGRGNNSRPIPR